MKKLTKLLVFSALMALFAAMTITAASAQTITNGAKFNTVINGAVKQFSKDAAPINVDGRTFVQFRELFAMLGGNPDTGLVYNEADKTVTLTKGEVNIVLTIGQNTAIVNGAEKQLDVAPIINNDRTYLPFRFIAENLGYTVNWNPDSFTAGAMDEATYQSILAMTNKHVGTEIPTAVELEMTMNANVSIKDPTGETSIALNGLKMTEQFSIAKKFMHMTQTGKVVAKIGGTTQEQVMNTEMYDDGKNMYIKDNGSAWQSMASAIASTSELLDPTNLINFAADPKLEAMSRMMYAAAVITNNGDMKTVDISIPLGKQELKELLSYASGIVDTGMTGSDMAAIISTLDLVDIKWTKPFDVKIVSNNAVGIGFSVSGKVAVTGIGTLANYSGTGEFDITIPKVNYNGDFATTVPANVIAEAKPIAITEAKTIG